VDRAEEVSCDRFHRRRGQMGAARPLPALLALSVLILLVALPGTAIAAEGKLKKGRG
jgi:hypothetical protein